MKNKWLLFAHNKQTFNSDYFGENTFTKTAWLDWKALDPYNQVVHPYVLQQEKLISDDDYWFSPKKDHNFWNLSSLPRFSYYPDIPMYNGIMVNMSFQ